MIKFNTLTTMTDLDNQLEEIVISGGGARGNGLGGVYIALKTTQAIGKSGSIWEGITTIAGTSVGSISATLFAVSPELEELNEDILNQDLTKILEIDNNLLPIGLSLNPLINFLNNYLIKHIKKHLLKELNILNKNNEDLPLPLSNLLKNLNQENYQVTFYDLDLLHQYYPNKFKNLIITSTSSDKGHKIVHLYNKNMPTQSIATACAASSALPLVFKPLQLNNSRQLDGGFGDPIPSEYFENDSTERQSKRLLFTFGPGPSFLGDIWQRTLHGRPASQLNFCTTREEMDNLARKKMSQNQIVSIWLDRASRKAHYHINFPREIQSTVSFNTLGIPEDKIPVDKASFNPYLINFYTELSLRKHLPSILGNNSPIWILNFFAPLIKVLFGFSFHGATLFESLCQRLRAFYSFNTVTLYSSILGTDFKGGEKTKRVATAFYYLDTINHLTLYNFTEQNHDFYINIGQNYLVIYKCFLKAQGIESDYYLKKHSKEKNPRVLFELIKEDLEKNHNSLQAFALCCAVELYLKQTTPDKILWEINKKSAQECSKLTNVFYAKRYIPQNRINLKIPSSSLILASVH